jgi:outer membrane protein TolC
VLDPAIAAEQVSQEDARFEAAFTLRADWRESDSPTASSLVAAQSRTHQVIPGVRIPTRTGGTVTIDMPLNRNENNNSFSTLNPAYSTDLEFTISHPLLRNAGRRAATASLRIAGYDEQAAASRTKLEVIRQLAAVDRSYWRLTRAKQSLDVAIQQHDLATEQLKRAERRVRAGSASEIEITRAQAGAADRLEAIIVAQNDVLLQQRELKRIINQPGLEIDTATMIVPASPPDPVEYVFDAKDLCARALANRMEMLELELQLAADAVRLEFARNQALPLLTLDYTYRINGLGPSFRDSMHVLEENHYEDWQIGLAAEVPLGNEAARARVRQAILSRLQRLSTKAAREQAIRQEVLNAVDQLDAGWQRILAARQSVILNTRALQAEQRQFDVGQSTSTNVLDAATRLAEAQTAEIRALSDYQVAQVDLAFATGTLLGAAKVGWSPAARPDLKQDDPAEELPEALRRPEGQRGPE